MSRADYKRRALKHEVLRELFLTGHAHIARDAARVTHHDGLRLKYERAARYPFLPVAPDPPDPPGPE